MKKQKIDLLPFPYREIKKDNIVIVIDVIRATSTITTFLGEGGEMVLVTEEVDEAFALKEKIKSPSYIAGERSGQKIEGFDFDNSPVQIQKGEVSEKTLILTTTNGTKTIKRYSYIPYLFMGSFLNLGYLSEVVYRLSVREGRDITIVCAGKEGDLVIDDILCGGAYVNILLQYENFSLTDAASLSYEYFLMKKENLYDSLLESGSGKNILKLGKKEDILFLSNIDRYRVSPYLFDREALVIKDFHDEKGDLWVHPKKI